MSAESTTAPRARTFALPGVGVGRRRRGGVGRQLGLQVICLLIGLTVIFPVLWIVAMSLDPRNLQRPDSLFPPGATLDAYARVIARPTPNNVSFLQLAQNSLFLAVVIAVASVTIGILAAYAFSRLRF